MPVFIAALGGMFINIVGTLAGRVLVALGIGVITYTGVATTLDWLKAGALSSLSGMPAEAVQLAGFLKVGTCISIVTSAMAARALIDGLSGDTFKRWVLK
ncbi:MAG: DUF2523 domain-containing protein [Acidobacteria bacterium]|nr:DUF2523 domain-containing protein [Acidobacteriota bacterium]